MREEEFMAKSQLTHSSALQFTQRAASWWQVGDKKQAGDKTANWQLVAIKAPAASIAVTSPYGRLTLNY